MIFYMMDRLFKETHLLFMLLFSILVYYPSVTHALLLLSLTKFKHLLRLLSNFFFNSFAICIKVLYKFSFRKNLVFIAKKYQNM